MLAKRIIPCLDVRDGQVVKGVNFIGIKEVGDPVLLAQKYSDEKADELVFLDITATHEGRSTMLDVVKRTAKVVFVPLTVGGGIRTIEDVGETLRAGADKVAINSAAVSNPELIRQAASQFGKQCVVVAIDGKKMPNGSWHVLTAGGRKDSGRDVIQWAKEAEIFGAGEILLTSMDADGTQKGFDIDMTKAVCQAVNIPVIASGGAGKLEDFSEVFQETNCDAALAASLFHFEQLRLAEIKTYLREQNIAVRWE